MKNVVLLICVFYINEKETCRLCTFFSRW